MVRKKGKSLLETKRVNRVYIKDTIFRREPVKRTDIAEELGLTLPTITTSINEMLEEHILQEIPIPEDKLYGGVGRKPVAIGFLPDAATSVGAEIGPYATRAVLMNMQGEILAQSEEEACSADYFEMLRQLSQQLSVLISHPQVKNLAGVGVGLPGYIESDRGVIRSHRNEDWIGRTLAQDLRNSLGVPVIIDNNVHMNALGYSMERKEKVSSSFAYFYMSRGIACPVMLRDSPLSGYVSGLGEIGHTILYINGDEKKSLDDLAGEKAILNQCMEMLSEGKCSILKEVLASEDVQELSMRHILMAQKMGDQDVCRLIKEKTDYLGTALANVVNLLNPGSVIVDSYLMTSTENQNMFKKSATENFFGLNEKDVKIIFRPYDQFNSAKGAAYFVIKKLFLEK